MKHILAIGFIFIFSLFSVAIFAQKSINRDAFYAAMASNKVSSVDAQLQSIQGLKNSEKEAFEGALLMRKAGLVAIPAKKLSLFKQGHKKLEGAIASDKNNAEYRFLRLLIQENAPKSLGYNKNIAEDSKMIKAAYKSFPEASRQSVLNFSKSSKVLPASAL